MIIQESRTGPCMEDAWDSREMHKKFWLENHSRKRQTERPRRRWENNKTSLREGWWYGATMHFFSYVDEPWFP